MKIRSITYFCNPKYPLHEKILQRAGSFRSRAKSAHEAAEGELQISNVRFFFKPFLYFMCKV